MTTKMCANDIYEQMKQDLKVWAKTNGVKLSVTRTSYDNFSIAILESETEITKANHLQVNPYHIEDDRRLTKEGIKLLMEIKKIANKNHWDDSDQRNDYELASHYISLDVGKYNKPYQTVCFTKDIDLSQALAMNLELNTLLKRNKKLSYNNRNAIENYTKLKTMFA